MAEPSDLGDCASRLAFVQSELDDQLKQYRRRRKRDKQKAFALQMSTVALSAAITVLLGMRNLIGLTNLFANIALALGALITVLAAADAFFSHRELWILRTQTVRELQDLSRDLRYYVSSLNGNRPCCAELDSFYRRLGEVIKRDNEDWGKLRTPGTRS